MRLVSYLENQQSKYGVAVDAGVVDLGGRIGNQYRDLQTLIEIGRAHV